MQDGRKAVWSMPYVSVASFFPSLKQNFIAYRSSKVSDCIFEIRQLWQSVFRRVCSNCCCSCSFKAEIIKIGQSSHKMYSNNILNFQQSTTILNACTKKFWNLLNTPYIYIYIYIYMYIYIIRRKKKYAGNLQKIKTPPNYMEKKTKPIKSLNSGNPIHKDQQTFLKQSQLWI